MYRVEIYKQRFTLDVSSSLKANCCTVTAENVICTPHIRVITKQGC